MGTKIHVLGGPNGVGKSTLGNTFSSDKGVVFINPDQIYSDQTRLHQKPPSQIELSHIIDVYIEHALNIDQQVLIESNLHNIEAFRFITSYINIYKAEAFCHFYYLDDVKELINRVKWRAEHLGNAVSEKTVLGRYASSYSMILSQFHVFDEVHFYDVSKLVPVKIFEVFDGELNYINANANFQWSDNMLEQILSKS
ncbi:hypothetical protein [Fulvivirga sediminis]|uniref:UDP-N-acetylglucosamine kinase n=1 Tax=Fulvivirga sediminis TaxID=2803949 RepID=A0A937K2A9_9BACT|nr:hypothetical protein [Fulvivirga sediminis]MBL3658391.1 hypothetical protein [Fulvivirga sediminis]